MFHLSRLYHRGTPPRDRLSKQSRKADRHLLRLEWLEPRTLLSTYYANNTSDSPIGVIGDLPLRAAIIAANANPGADTIVLNAGTYGLTLFSASGASDLGDTSAIGDLDVTDPLTIIGAGRDATVINGNQRDRVFQNFSTLTLQNLTITGGKVVSQITPLETGGGGILNSGALTLNNCLVTGNTSGTGLLCHYGGGICSSGTLSLYNTIISGNESAYYGGAVYSSNTYGTNTISGCTISGNTARSQYYYGSAVNAAGGTWVISNSTFSGNSGGLFLGGGTLTVTNSTFANNGGVYGLYTGSAIYFSSSTGTGSIASSTISGNKSYYTNSGNGGALYVSAGSTLTVKNTIVAGNTSYFTGISDGGSVPPAHPDVVGSVSSQGNNLIGNGTGSSGWTNGDLVGTSAGPIDPKLGPLQENGGSTPTMALLTGSPAIDAGNNSGAPATDQRGQARIVDGNGDGTARIDIGAYEWAPPPAMFSLAGPTSGTFTAGQSVPIQWTADNVAAGSSVNLCLDSDAAWNGNETTWKYGAAAANGDGTYNWDTSGLAAGTYYVCGYLWQGGKAIYSHLTQSITIQAVAQPTFTLTGPASGTFTVGQSVSIQWTAGNVAAGSSVNLCLDSDAAWNGNETTWKYGVAVTNGNGTYTWNTTGVAPGTYYVCGYLWQGGKATYSHLTQSVTIQSNAPAATFALTGPTSGNYTAGQPVPIQWTAGNVAAGSSVNLCLDSDAAWNGNETTWKYGVVVTNGSGTYNWNTTNVAPGTYYIGGYLYSGGTPYYSHLPQSITIQAAGGPTFDLTGPTSGTFTVGQSVPINWTASNIVAGSSVNFCLDSDTAWNGNETTWKYGVAVTNGNGTYNWDTTGLAPGTYYIGGYLWSGGKPTSSHLAQSITIQSPVVGTPTFTLTGPTSGTVTVGQSVSIQWTGGNVAAGSSVNFCLDSDAAWNGNETWIKFGQAAANGNGSYSWNTTGVAPGTYYIGGYLYSGGKPTYSHLTQSITIQAAGQPTFTLTGPTSGTYADSTSSIVGPVGVPVPIQWTAGNVAAGSTINLCLDTDTAWNGNETWIKFGQAAANGNGAYSWYANVAAGTYYVGGYLYSGGKPYYWHLTQPITILSTPAFTLTGPTSGAFTAGQTVPITWTTTGGSEVALCYDTDTVFNSNETWINTFLSAANGSGSYNWDTTGVAPGTYYVGGYLCIRDFRGLPVGGYYYSHLTQPITIQPATTATALTLSGSALTATVTSSVSGGATPTGGTVTFLDGSTTLGSAPLVAGTATLSPSLAVGTHLLTAVYSGSGTFAGSRTTVGPSSPIYTFAGSANQGYSGDGGQANAAKLNLPMGVATDGAGNIYIADTWNSCIREVNVSTGIISSIAGNAGNGNASYGGDGGQATAAYLSYPYDVAVDSTGNIFIADTTNQRIREIDHTTGIITTVAGNGYEKTFGVGGYSGDGGQATAAELNNPTSIAVDGAGNLYIVDADNNRIRKVDHSTGIITTVAGNGYKDSLGHGGYSGDGGQATAAELNIALSVTTTTGVALDAAGNLYITDGGNQRIRKVNHSTGIITTVAGNGYEDAYGGGAFSGDGGQATAAELDFPSGLALDSAGNLFIADHLNQRIREVNVSTGIITTIAGNGSYGFSGDGGQASAATLNFPTDVAVDGAGNLYIADNTNNRIRNVPAGVEIHVIKMKPQLNLAAPDAALLRQQAAVSALGGAVVDSQSELTPIVNEAIRRWALVAGSQVLAGVSVQIADLPGTVLGETDGQTILIDRDAAGYGWFIDPTPGDDLEFTRLASNVLAARPQTAADRRADLLSTVMHELGHELGYADDAVGDLMSATLPLGVRRMV